MLRSKENIFFYIAIPFLAITLGLISGAQPLLIVGAFFAAAVLFLFFNYFEQTVIGLLLVRNSLDVFTDYQLPAAYTLGLVALTILYVIVKFITNQNVKTDNFWWFMIAWSFLQGIWLILLLLGALELDAGLFQISFREWFRMISIPLIYLLTLQLDGKVNPLKFIIFISFAAMIFPIFIALLQMFVPSVLPEMLSGINKVTDNLDLVARGEDVSRIRGTFIHANTLCRALVISLGVAIWELENSNMRWPWLLLLPLFALLIVGTKSMSGLIMLAIVLVAAMVRKMSLSKLVIGVLMFLGVLLLFSSSEYGQSRLESLYNLPFVNPEIDFNRAVILARNNLSNNSLNWRLSHWKYLLDEWEGSSFFGYGIGLSTHFHRREVLAPHNDYVKFLIEQGYIGVMLLLSFIGAHICRAVQLIRDAKDNRKKQAFSYMLLVFSIATAVGMITENIFRSSPYFVTLWSLFAVASWNWNNQEYGSDPDARMREQHVRAFSDKYHYLWQTTKNTNSKRN